MNSKLSKGLKFIEIFLEVILTDKYVPGLLKRESWHYKDLRIGGYDPKKIYRNVENLASRGILKKVSPGRYALSSKGKNWAKKAAGRYFTLRYRKWDKKWRIVIFDIPEELYMARIHFRRKIKSLGFYTLQKSVFVFPYPCEEELGDICKELEISDYVDVIVAQSPGFKEKELKEYYNLL